MKMLVVVFVGVFAVIGTIQGFPQVENNVPMEANNNVTKTDNQTSSGSNVMPPQQNMPNPISVDNKPSSNGNGDKQNSGTGSGNPPHTSAQWNEQSVVIVIGGSPQSASGQENTVAGGVAQNSNNGATNNGQSSGPGSPPQWLSRKLCGNSIIFGRNQVFCSALCLNFYSARSGSCTSSNTCVCTN